MIRGDYDMCPAWNNRIWNAQQEDEHSLLYYCYECGHINQTGVYSILKGSPNQELAELYMAWIGFPVNAARITNHIAYGPLSREAAVPAEEMIYPEFTNALPTSPVAMKRVVLLDRRVAER